MTKEYLIKSFLGHMEDNYIQKEAVKVLNEKGKIEAIKVLKSYKSYGSSAPNLVGYIQGEDNGVAYKDEDWKIVLVATWNDIIEYLKPELRKINKLGEQAQLI